MIRRGQDWGDWGRPDPDVPTVRSDREASALLESGKAEFLLVAGDMALTLGATEPTSTCLFRKYPIDVVRITLSSRNGKREKRFILSHCSIRHTCLFGGMLRGRSIFISNSQYWNGRVLAPKGHPNDGRIQLLEMSDSMSIRQRFQTFLRLQSGTHLPHPDIHVQHLSRQVDMGLKGVVFADGRRLGRMCLESFEVIPDGAVVWVAVQHSDRVSAGHDWTDSTSRVAD